MSGMMHPARRTALLNSVARPAPAKAKVELNDVEFGRLIRRAIQRTGLSQKEAMDALGVDDKGYFSRMLDGKETFNVLRLFRPEAAAIRRQLWLLDAASCGFVVEQVIKIREQA